MADPGEGPLILDQTDAWKAEKIILGDPPPFSKGLDDRPPPLSQGLDLSLQTVMLCQNEWVWL